MRVFCKPPRDPLNNHKIQALVKLQLGGRTVEAVRKGWPVLAVLIVVAHRCLLRVGEALGLLPGRRGQTFQRTPRA